MAYKLNLENSSKILIDLKMRILNEPMIDVQYALDRFRIFVSEEKKYWSKEDPEE